MKWDASVELLSRAYYDSAPSTPRGGDAAGGSLPASPRSGAEMYQQYIDTYRRRTKKPQPVYTDDAAGLLGGSKLHGRRTPLKGKGIPPPDHYEPEYHPSKRMVPGKSFVSIPGLLVHHDKHEQHPLSMSVDSGLLALAASGAAGLLARPATAQGRPSLRIMDQSFHANLTGAGLSVISEVPVHRPIRRPGTAAPHVDTKTRVMVLACPAEPSSPTIGTAPDVWTAPSTPPAAAGSHASSRWAAQYYEAMSSPSSPSHSARPSTAPAAQRPTTEARQRYHAQQTASKDVFQYRHSGGIAPAEYKFDATRAPAPHTSSPSKDAAREAYFETRTGFACNRVRAIISARQYA